MPHKRSDYSNSIKKFVSMQQILLQRPFGSR